MSSLENWKSYFNSHIGLGFLSTANASGKVNTAVYARPHVQINGDFAFIMNDRRSFANVSENPFAVYAFIESNSSGYRFYLKREVVLTEGILYDVVLSESRKPPHIQDSGKDKYVVLFKLTEVRPLVGE